MRRGSFLAFAAPFLPLLVLFFPVTLLLGAILLGSTAGGVLTGLVCTGALTGVLAVKHHRLVTGTVVRFSAAGVELSDSYGFRLFLEWPRVERIGVVESRMASPRPIGRPGGPRVRAGAMRTTGLAGWGTRQVPSRVPRWMRDRLAGVPVDPATGLQWLGIPLGAVDPHWEKGPMGDWVRRQRPDLLG
ncbi:hypothetical protein [Nonomuraea rhizosphaerae]|uniref:hypothetical protein n=1 Tax=Nonomuraea rhizosphaerae TaxID=2665663 RepID=UPI001C601100|nr:hypothetical protein [Nonomuraea rhizosphaerae]